MTDDEGVIPIATETLIGMKRDEHGHTKLDRLRIAAHHERRKIVVETVIITAIFAIPIGILIGWLTAT